jgi:hypothetical protein
MNAVRWLPAAMLCVLSVGAARAQSGSGLPPPDWETPPRAEQAPCDGFWPTETMINRFLDQTAYELAEQYEFDDEQLRLTNEVLHDTFPAWLEENKAEMKTLINQFIEAQLNDEPPSVEDVAIWARRALPLVNEFRGLVFDMTDDMRGYMTEDQIDRLEGETAAFDTGVTLFSNKLYVWADGGYDPETEWLPPGRERRRQERAEERERREAMEQARQQALAQSGAGQPGQATTSPAVVGRPKPKDEWEEYTVDFTRRYQLNSEQRQKAMQFLRGAQQQRNAYLTRTAEARNRVKARLEQSQSQDEEAQKAALAEDEALHAPLKRMFEKLKERLDTLPTRDQRREAALRHQEKRKRETAGATDEESATPRAPAGSAEPRP